MADGARMFRSNTFREEIAAWKMLTPRFELSQDEDYLIVLISTPYVKVWHLYCVQMTDVADLIL